MSCIQINKINNKELEMLGASAHLFRILICFSLYLDFDWSIDILRLFPAWTQASLVDVDGFCLNALYLELNEI